MWRMTSIRAAVRSQSPLDTRRPVVGSSQSTMASVTFPRSDNEASKIKDGHAQKNRTDSKQSELTDKAVKVLKNWYDISPFQAPFPWVHSLARVPWVTLNPSTCWDSPGTREDGSGRGRCTRWQSTRDPPSNTGTRSETKSQKNVYLSLKNDASSPFFQLEFWRFDHSHPSPYSLKWLWYSREDPCSAKIRTWDP